MKIEISHPFNDAGSSAYLVSSQGRNTVCIYNSITRKRTSMSYARYLMSVHLQRKLSKDEHVDHINSIKNDDRISNLQILSLKENNRKQALIRGKKVVVYICPVCLAEFKKPHNQSHFIIKKTAAFCGRSCAAKFQMTKDKSSFGKPINVVNVYRDTTGLYFK